jgi:hypothetical protein
LEGDNLYIRPNGNRSCRTCLRKGYRDYHARQRQANHG